MAAKPSVTWAIISALAAQLATITIANGYLTDIGNNVWTSKAQRTSDDALGLTIYSGDIAGPGADNERPAKPVREFNLYVEADISTTLDNAAQQIHDVIEDIDVCMKAYGIAQQKLPPPQQTPMHVLGISIEDQPEGMPVIGMQAHIFARFFR